MPCPDPVGILQPREIKESWPEKCAENLGDRVNDFSGALDSLTEPWIAGAIDATRKLARGMNPVCLDGIIDAKASLHVIVMFWVRGIRFLSDGSQVGFASMKS